MPMGGMGGGMGGFGGGGFGGAPSLGGFGFSVSFAQAESAANMRLHTMSPVQALAAGAAVAAAVAAVALAIRRKARAANSPAAQLI